MLKSRGWLALFGTHTASFLSLFLFVASTPNPLCRSLTRSLSLSISLLWQNQRGSEGTSVRQV